jgi:hypothetical protein
MARTYLLSGYVECQIRLQKQAANQTFLDWRAPAARSYHNLCTEFQGFSPPALLHSVQCFTSVTNK